MHDLYKYISKERTIMATLFYFLLTIIYLYKIDNLRLFIYTYLTICNY